MIKDRARSIAFVDEDEEEMESEDERNGVGNPVSLSPGDPGCDEGATQTQGTLLSGWSATQSQLPDDPQDIPDETHNDSLAEYAEFTQSSASARLSTIANRASSTPAVTSWPGPINTHLANEGQVPSQPHTASSTTHSTNTGTGSTGTTGGQGTAASRRAKAAQPQAALHTTLASFFNPEARAAREQELGMSHFYAVRLQEANSTIARLQEETNRLREGINVQVLRLQEELRQARHDLGVKSTKNQDLRHRIEMIQLCMDMQTGGFPGMQGMMCGPIYGQTAHGHGTNAWEVNTNGAHAHTQ
ncbi:hypothetical protein PGT21_020962 [Puccinia graminis f. sp. tritici]|uniref:Uncharacterized protein n=1 Tax=Puccinia graminis f. sp. tritici TaxID=56615 RepID=A0A5B0NCM7_PUCGR|nr:hypothetical protein PGT21_020962 [Puccinia graminis f. sp. tritici]KAA1112132.1 hypothetical protein PGTUg99_006380 [Puccinia graminis f. sp. tritici]